jgi:hypothetical protein
VSVVRRGGARLGWAAFVAIVVAIPSVASAEPSDIDKARAQVLFEEGRELLETGKIDAACDRFERSQKLEPASGTLLNLAACHERAGRIATAWVVFHDAIGAATRDGRADREAFAREHITALTPRLPRIVVRGHACTGCELFLDGRRVDRAVVSEVTPIDPGEHRLVMRAPSGNETEAVKATAREGDLVEMAVPSLLTPASTADAPPPPASSKRTLGFVSLGVSAAALGAGVFFGVRALSLGADADAACPAPACSDPGAVDLSQQADTSAWIANAAIGTAVLTGGLGAYLLLTSKSPSRSTANAMRGRIEF